MATQRNRPGATELFELEHPRTPQLQRVAASRFGMIATAHPGATRAGVEILAQGGNAVDAAVAAGFALGVCEPFSSGLGGQTMMLIRLVQPRKKTFALDGSSRAPNRATAEAFRDVSRRRGHAATTVPSTPAVLDYALQHYGTMKLSRVLAPAVRLAGEGFAVTRLFHALSRRELKRLKTSPAGPLLLKAGARPYPVGAVLRQPVLAETLRRLARHGVKSFYRGKIARWIDEDMRAHDGLLRRDDLAQVPLPIERRPVACHFEGLRVLTFPPPGAGRTLVEMLQILENFSPRQRDPDTPQGAVLLAQIIRQAFRDRRDRPFDPSFYTQVNDEQMLSPEYAARAARRIRRPPKTKGETTHLSVMDRYGNVVALTQSIEQVFGSFAASPQLGFLYNNYMSAFEYEDISHPYYLRPNAVPWASVAPTIVFRGRRPWMAIGSPGSERIVSAIMQVLLRLEKQSPYDAVAAPRLHCSLDSVVSLEATRMRSDVLPALGKRGFSINACDPYAFYLGSVQMVLHEKKTFIGVADPRRDGTADGPDR